MADPTSSYKPAVKKFQSLDEVFKFFSNKGSRISRRRWKALEPSKEIIKSELFMHQKLGLGWLIHRENTRELPPFWVKNKQRGLYKNLLTDCKTNERPNPLRGGVFADDMGFGKTLTLISLIATDIRPFSFVLPSSSSSVLNTSNRYINIVNLEEEEEEIEESRKRSMKGKQSEEEIVGSNKKRKKVDSTIKMEDENLNNLGIRRTTLIVCPPAVLLTWTTQLREHTRPGMLKVFTYSETPHRDVIKVEDLQRYDIVLTTYDDTLGHVRRNFSHTSPIMKMEWFRVILDDAHVIFKNGICFDNDVFLLLKAKSRWVVTGMPILNGSYNLHFVMAFLKFEPFSANNYWRTLVQIPIEKGNKNGLSRLQELVATISLRRLKGDCLVGLPPKTVETCFVKLSAEDRVKYDLKEEDSQRAVQTYLRLGRAAAQYSTIFAIIQRLRQMCNDLASCPSEALASHNIEDVSKNPELLRKMVSELRDGDYSDCPVCYSPLSDPIITCCGHIFCKNCILKALNRAYPCYPSCPLCRRRISKSDLFSAPPEEEPCDDDGNKTANRGSSGSTAYYSSKVSALLKLLVASRNENPAVKSVVFSQFRKMLILLEEPLKAAGFGTLRLDGLMSLKGKAYDVITEFKIRDSNSPATVLLVDLTASQDGIDLTGASRVYLLEPWLNPAVEEQAMNRVHRIGQEDVKIIRLITRNSIEERILELHERKKNLDFGKNMNQRQIRREELSIIMGLCSSRSTRTEQTD